MPLAFAVDANASATALGNGLADVEAKASYLEVLTAQESLLNAQLSEAMNMYDAANAVIELYIALGGGSK